MLSKLISCRARQLGAALLLTAAAWPALALPVMELRAEDLMPMASDFKKTLNLNANQQTLWQQTETRTRQLLRDRQARRERLQMASKAGLDAANVELRELVAPVDAETAVTATEDRQLREWWLTVNDALDEGQRRKVAALLSEQLMRMADEGGGASRAPRTKDEGGEHGRGGGRRGQGGGVGMGVPGGAPGG